MEIYPYRALIDFGLTINVISVAHERASHEYVISWCEENSHLPAARAIRTMEPPADQHIADMQLLQEGMFATPGLLEIWIEDTIREALRWSRIYGTEPRKTREDLLAPIIATLPPRLRRRLLRMIRENDFMDAASEVYDCVCALPQRGSVVPAEPAAVVPADWVVDPTERRVVIDIDVEPVPITMEAMWERYTAVVDFFEQEPDIAGKSFYIPPVPSQQLAEDLQMLQDAARAFPDARDALNREAVLTELVVRDLDTIEPFKWPDLLLGPLVETLPPRQRHRVREMIAAGTFDEEALFFYQGAECHIRRVTIEPVLKPKPAE